MSTRYNDGSHYENHQRAAELHDAAAHAHRVAEQQHGKQDHLTGQEHSRQALADSGEAHKLSQQLAAGHGVTSFTHQDIADLAYQLWQKRGCPAGSSDEDWFHAAEQLRSRSYTR